VASSCSIHCPETRAHPSGLRYELNVRRRIGMLFVFISCGLAYSAIVLSTWFWIPVAIAACFGTYQTVSSNGCLLRGSSSDTTEHRPLELTPYQSAFRLRIAHRLFAATIMLAAVSSYLLPALWPLAAIAGWFTASFYMAAWTGYVGCPEIGAILSWLLGWRLPTQCAPLRRRDSHAGQEGNPGEIHVSCCSQ
jgi:hypothetical protein